MNTIDKNYHHSKLLNHLLFMMIGLVCLGFFIQYFSLKTFATMPTDSSGPNIVIQENSWDFGEIHPKDIPTHSIIIKNAGNGILTINRIKVACESCIDVSISKKEIMPNESVELKITVNSLDITGHFTKRIVIQSNDQNNPQSMIAVTGFVKNDSKTTESNESEKKLNIQTSADITKSYTQGIALYRKGEYEKAIIEFESVIKNNPTHTDSYYYLGQCYLQWGIVEYNKKHILKAYSLYRKANKIADQVILLYMEKLEENPNDLNTLLKLGYIYEVKSIVPFVDEYENALKYYSEALNLETVSLQHNTVIYIYLNTRIGIMNFQLKDYLQAISYLEKSLEVSASQDNIEVYYYLGKSYDKINENEKALDSLFRVIEVAPQSEFAREAQKEIKRISKK